MCPERSTLLWGVAGVVAVLVACGPVALLVEAPTKSLRPEAERASTGGRAGVRVTLLGVDGLRADVFEPAMKAGQLPGFSRFLGGTTSQDLSHVYFHPEAISVFPSVTASGWSSFMTGHPPGANGVPGNEFLIRPEARFVAPVPLSVDDDGDFLASFNDRLFATLLETPTVYANLHEKGLRSWVASNHVHIGADRLLLPQRGDLLEGFGDHLLVQAGLEAEGGRYVELDEGTFGTVLEELEGADPPPDVLMVYASGVDLISHHVPGQVVDIQRRYLIEHLDDKVGALADALAQHGEGYRLLLSDHGHSEVPPDHRFALGRHASEAPAFQVLRRAGFRPFGPALGLVDENADAAVAYQSGAAFVYLARREPCTGVRCGWREPPRYREDVLRAADAFLHAGQEGELLHGALDAVLVREPRPFDEEDLPFSVYRGAGQTETIGAWLASRAPAGGSVHLEERLRDLATGRYGERAGDILLLTPQFVATHERYYFSSPYASTHGSARRSDSHVPFAVAHPRHASITLQKLVLAHTGPVARPHEVAGLVLRLATTTDGGSRNGEDAPTSRP
ncbi:MAG: alkaline phosphatase family protein [Myxococcota bacterium]